MGLIVGFMRVIVGLMGVLLDLWVIIRVSILLCGAY